MVILVFFAYCSLIILSSYIILPKIAHSQKKSVCDPIKSCAKMFNSKVVCLAIAIHAVVVLFSFQGFPLLIMFPVLRHRLPYLER